MKLIAFGVRKDEEPYFKNWEQENGAEIKLVPDLLSEKNIDLIKGYDGIIGLQTTPYKREYFEKMKDAGIKILSIRNIGICSILDASCTYTKDDMYSSRTVVIRVV